MQLTQGNQTELRGNKLNISKRKGKKRTREPRKVEREVEKNENLEKCFETKRKRKKENENGITFM